MKEKAQILKKREAVLKDKKAKLAVLEDQVATKSSKIHERETRIKASV